MPESAAETVRACRFGLVPSLQGRSLGSRAAPSEELSFVDDALAKAGVPGRGEIAAVTSSLARRSTMLVSFADGSCAFMKWLDADSLYASDNEVFILRLLESISLPPTLRAAVPRIVAFDADQQLLVLEGVAGFKTMREIALARRGLGVDELVRLAAVLGALHRLDVNELRAAHPDRSLFFPMQSMMDLTPEEFARGPGSEYAAYVEAVQAVDEEIQQLGERWRPLRLTHFDVRDDNVLLAVDRPGRSDPLRLVDWELAGFGDALYDVGTVVGQLVYHSLRTLRPDADAAHALAGDGAGLTPAPGGRSAAIFVNAYLELSRPSRPDVRPEIIRYAGAFLLLRALATLQATGSLGVAGKLSLLLGRRFLTRPDISTELVLPPLPSARA
jgi:hypothetical protein